MKDNKKKPAKGKGRGNQPARRLSREEVAANIQNAINNCPANNNQRRIALQNLQQVNRNSNNNNRNSKTKKILSATQQQILELLEQDQPDEGRMNRYRDRRPYSEWYALILRRNFDLPPHLRNNTHVRNHFNHIKAIHDGEDDPGGRPDRSGNSSLKSSSAAKPQPQTQATNANNVHEERGNLMGGEGEEDRMDEERFRRPSNIDTSSYHTSAPLNPAMTIAAPHPMDNVPIPPDYPGPQYSQYHGYQPPIAQQYQSFAPSNTPAPLRPDAQPVGQQVPTQQLAASRQTFPQQQLPQTFPPQHLPRQRPSQQDTRQQHLVQQYLAQQRHAQQLARQLVAQQHLFHQSTNILGNLSNSSSPSIMGDPQHPTPRQASTPTMQASRPLQADNVPSNVPNTSATVNPDHNSINHTQFPFPSVGASRQSLPHRTNDVLNDVPSSPNPAVHDNMNTYPANDDRSSAPTVDAGTTQPSVATTETDEATDAEQLAQLQTLVSRPPLPVPVATEYPRQPANRAHDADNQASQYEYTYGRPMESQGDDLSEQGSQWNPLGQ